MAQLLMAKEHKAGAASMASDAPRYHFGPLSKAGLIAGWRGGQIACVAGSLLVAVGILRAGWGWPGAVPAFALVLAGAAAACWTVSGRTIEEWFPIVLTWLTRPRGQATAVLPLVGHHSGTLRSGWERMANNGSQAIPGGLASLARCRVLNSTDLVGTPGPGVVHDRAARTYTSVLAVRGQSFALLDAQDKNRRVAAWAGLMAGLSREDSAVHRLAWVRRSLPDDAAAVSRYLVANAKVELGSPPGISYAALVEESGPLTQRHEVFLVLSVKGQGRGNAGRSMGDKGACAQLVRETRFLEEQLRGVDVDVTGVLSPAALAHCLRQAVQSNSIPSSGSVWPWPLAAEATWSSLHTDSLWHATYWVAEWPRIDVGPDFLSPLLLRSGARQSVAVVMEPLSPSRAQRDVEQARTGGLADEELRRRAGFMLTARRRREQEAVAQREVELADGHADYRFSGYVTVSAPDLDGLEAACARVEQTAAQSRLELRRLFGCQDQAFTWTLPLARGLA
ncbi:MAG: SCO6880 family protein [Acidimicrobiales bacterium]